MRLAIFSAVMAAMLGACATPAEAPVAATAEAANVQVHEFAVTSKRTGLQYVVLVSAPAGPMPAGKTFPAIYVTDGNWYFSMAVDTARAQAAAGMMEPAFVVGIAYPDGEFESVATRRERELVHRQFKGANGMTGGGGEDFANFVIEDVRPLVEQRFAIDRSRTVLTGHSLGGLFVTKVLLAKPESFSGYLIGSPSLWADMPTINAARSFTAGAGHRVYVGVGGGEAPMMRASAKNLGEALSASTTGLSVASAEFGKFEHMKMQPSWFEAGLDYLLPKTN